MGDPPPTLGDLPEIAERFGHMRHALEVLATSLAEKVVAAGWSLADWKRPVCAGGDVEQWPTQWWGAHEAQPASVYTTSRFDWVLWGFERDRPLRFGAGLVWSHWRGQPNPLNEPTWLDQMLALEPEDGWGRFEPPSNYDGIRLYRSVPLECVAAEPNAAAQATLLADLVTSTFRALERHSPPETGQRWGGHDDGH